MIRTYLYRTRDGGRVTFGFSTDETEAQLKFREAGGDWRKAERVTIDAEPDASWYLDEAGKVQNDGPGQIYVAVNA